MDIVLHVVHVITALALIGLILVQQGKGADAGASFGGGASQAMLGSASGASFLTRTTAILAVVFMLTSLTLAWHARQQAEADDVILPAMETDDDLDVPGWGEEEDEGVVPGVDEEADPDAGVVPEVGEPADEEGAEVPEVEIESPPPEEAPE